jgi:hypothetical protein
MAPERPGATRVRAGVIDAEIAPPTLRGAESAALRQQHAAQLLQAGYLLVLLAAPVSRLLPLPDGHPAGVDDAVSALLLLVAVGMRLLLRAVAADADWVRARRESEDLRAAAWRRCATGSPVPDDGPLSQQLRTADVGTRWQFYRRNRMDDQIAYFAGRADRHRRTARRWKLVRLLLTVGTVGVAAASLLVAVPAAVIGLVAALLATSEAWLQFRRSEVLAASFADARDELRTLRERTPSDEEDLAHAVDVVELALEHERWTWTAIMSVTVLTSPGTPAGRMSTVDGRSG